MPRRMSGHPAEVPRRHRNVAGLPDEVIERPLNRVRPEPWPADEENQPWDACQDRQSLQGVRRSVRGSPPGRIQPLPPVMNGEPDEAQRVQKVAIDFAEHGQADQDRRRQHPPARQSAPEHPRRRDAHRRRREVQRYEVRVGEHARQQDEQRRRQGRRPPAATLHDQHEQGEAAQKHEEQALQAAARHVVEQAELPVDDIADERAEQASQRRMLVARRPEPVNRRPPRAAEPGRVGDGRRGIGRLIPGDAVVAQGDEDQRAQRERDGRRRSPHRRCSRRRDGGRSRFAAFGTCHIAALHTTVGHRTSHSGERGRASQAARRSG